MEICYRRILLKLSGEALAGGKGFGIDLDTTRRICEGVRDAHALGAEVAVVVGGGNFWRGRDGAAIERTRSDQIGMLATVMNALAVADMLEQLDTSVRVQTAITMQAIAEPYIRNRAIRHMQKGRIVVLGCGTGNPYFSTDTAAALRAAEINAEIIFKATMVDGVYNKDPKQYGDAVKYKTLTFSEVLNQNLKVMDSTAATMCRDNNLPILVFDISDPQNISRALRGEEIGTLVQE
ncbi:UMP kinase [Ruminococcaceae bacterium OttesenSCG-928-O06]|nr:UMP kinase [Ruminococcaceae bacterium OttesenSCG-928-O06]